ncbi:MULTISPECIES: SGNH/GDSL hydrolase family protein [unclassified Sulfitobacter]|jgi:acyl-CoA thioesterase-1|uniref:SGNH/GDSL hydrolase family protein n=1 Tax=unclassified Sulfitobacter TaxID=196795 RepID=UPI0015930DF0|nr:SGNH/GDSL hydrolase family protein [Sulfitobacter sp. HGT1]
MTSFITSRARIVLVLLFGLAVAACTDTAPKGGGDILVIGDSVMAWNGRSDQAIPDVIAKTLGRQVTNKAIPGAKFDNGSALFSAIGFDIQRQYPGGSWNWVVVDGGANDLGFDDCKCAACRPVVDELIGPDTTSGTIPAFLAGLRDSGAQVIWMGYYKGNGKGSFEGCRDDLVLLERRIARFAARTPGVTFLDSEMVIDPADPTQFASDNTHPSPKGSALIGSYLAKAISERDPRSQ